MTEQQRTTALAGIKAAARAYLEECRAAVEASQAVLMAGARAARLRYEAACDAINAEAGL